MNWFPGLWLLMAGAIAALVWAKVTRWYELLLIGGFGVMTGALLVGATSWSAVSITNLWKVFFS